ncbi:MAG: hypothetical protein EBR82_26460 [Caulobacteraceae bacterium]|nr:hypothetical protein [Caulobacteraceae bacterium]
MTAFDTDGLHSWTDSHGNANTTTFYQLARFTLRVNSWTNRAFRWPLFSRWSSGVAITWRNMRLDVRTRRL